MAQVISQTFNVNLNLSNGQIALLNSDGTYTIDSYDAYISSIQSGSTISTSLGIALIDGNIITVGGYAGGIGSLSVNSGASTVSYIKDSFDSINMTKEGVIQAPELVEEEIFTTNDGAKFLKIFSHNVSGDKTMFSKASTGLGQGVYYNLSQPNGFSMLGDIPKYRGSDGKFEFLIKYPEYQNVPAGYDELEYIESTGTQYILTNVSPASNYKFMHDIQFTHDGNRQLMGFDGNTGSYWGMNASGQYEMEGGTSINSSDRHFVDYIPGVGLRVDGVFVRLVSNFATYNGLSYAYFALNTNTFNAKAKLYKAQIYDSSDKIIRDYVPAKRRSDGVLGLYDLITKTFYTNNGSGTFIAGPVVRKTIKYNRWKQTSNPLIVNSDSTMTQYKNGYEPVEISYIGRWYYGMGRSSSANAFLDVEAGHGDWWFGIGQNNLYNDGLTGPSGIVVKAVELYIRVDNTDFKEGIKFQDSLKPIISDNVFVNASASIRPLSYIEGLGTGYYIDTGWVPTSIDFKVECNFVLTGTAVDQTVWGVGGGICSLNTMPADANKRWQFGCSANWINVTHDSCTTNKEITAICESKAGLQTLTINGEQLVTANYQSQVANSQPVYLYINNMDTDSYNAGAKICYFKAWENGELVRDMIPVMVNMSMAGWYDKVTDEFKQYYQMSLDPSNVSANAVMGDLIYRDAALIVNEIVED